MPGKLHIEVVSTESYKNGSYKTICEVLYHTSPVYSQITMTSTTEAPSSGLRHFVNHIRTNSSSTIEIYKVFLYQRAHDLGKRKKKKAEAMFLFHTCLNYRKAKELFHVINSILSPIISRGNILFSKNLLDEIMYPELNCKQLLCKLIRLVNDSPSICSNWSKLLQSLMQHLCHHNKTTIGSILLDQDFFDCGCESIFHSAAREESGRIIEVLLSLLEPEERKTVTTAKDANGNTPLSIALRHRNYVTTKCLIKAGANAKGHIFEAIETNCHEFLLGVVETGSSCQSTPPLRSMLNEFDNSTNFTQLMFAVVKQHVQCALHLLLGGANPNTPHPMTGDTALHIAASLSNATLVKLLVIFDAQVSLENNFGETASNRAKMRGHKEIISIFNDIYLAEEESLQLDEATQKQLNPGAITLLSLDGCGMKGLLLIQTLITLEKRMKSMATTTKSITACFDYVAGSGTGGLVALLLTYCDHLTHLDMMALMFGVTNNLLSNTTAAAMESLFMELYGADMTMSSCTKPQLVIPVRSIRPSCRHRQKLLPGHLISNFDDNGEELKVWEAAQCTMPAPFCPSNSKELPVDVTLLANNPTMATIAKIHAWAKSRKGGRIECVVSLGTRNCHGIKENMVSNAMGRKKEECSTSVLDEVPVMERLHQLNNLEIEKAKVWCKSTGSSYFRLAPDLTKALEMDSMDHHTLIIECMYHNHLHLKRETESISTMAKFLLTK